MNLGAIFADFLKKLNNRFPFFTAQYDFKKSADGHGNNSELQNVEIDEYCQRQFEDLRLSELLQNVDIEEYLAIDDDVATSGVPSRADFYLKNQESSFESEEDLGESHEKTSQISFADAHQSLRVVLKFFGTEF